jgi:hypothetical protein
VIELLANAYRGGAAVTPTDREIKVFAAWIDQKFLDIPCTVQFWSGDISLSECKDSFVQSGILNVSTAHNCHPILSKQQNAKFRAIHDWDHIILDANDGMIGEYTTWLHNDAPNCIQWILFSEIVLQAAACLHADGEFQPQKLVKMPGF